jgi:hypothetical protein
LEKWTESLSLPFSPENSNIDSSKVPRRTYAILENSLPLIIDWSSLSEGTNDISSG